MGKLKQKGSDRSAKDTLEEPGNADLGHTGGKPKCIRCPHHAWCSMPFNSYISSFIYDVILFFHQLFKACIITYSITDERNEAQRDLRICYQPHSN